jgi:glycosyltransferase involved in cell wall biosynthesis
MESMEKQYKDRSIRDLKALARRLTSIGLHKIGLLIPHLHSFGGIFRFIELSLAFQTRGFISYIIVPDEAFDEERISWINANYGKLSIMRLSQAIHLNWDVVICGDFSSGIMCHLPFFKTRIRCSYLLNGWQHRYINKKQIEAVSPELVVANSSYCSDHYPDLFPVVVPGGINFNRVSQFKKLIHRDIDVSSDVVKVVCPSGRLKPRKRFSDALAALNLLASKGFRIELHTFDVIEVQVDENENLRHKHHMGLGRDALFQLLSNMDIGIYPEEDAGWNNPVAEAACCCLPVVCTPAGTVDFISHELSGLVVPPKSPDLIAEFAEKLILDSALREFIAKNAYKSIQSFDWQQTADRLINIFEETRHSKEPACSSIGINGVEHLLREIAPIQES